MSSKLSKLSKLPKVLILYANGTNRERDVAFAFELAGAVPEVVHINQLRNKQKHWADYQILVIPGGFSYADTLGAGKLFALALENYFAEQIQAFIASGKPVIGICNGFQVLVKSGLLPEISEDSHDATLTFNQAGHFECRWVTLLAQAKNCLWTKNLSEPIYCPVAHGEGRFLVKNEVLLEKLLSQDQIALSYATPNGDLALDKYPENPNGSVMGIAGICNPQGNVLGLMPHPENHVLPHQHPRWTRGEHGQSGLALFKNGVDYVR
jgi:phosphoribosylformylglycinamidine synthase